MLNKPLVTIAVIGALTSLNAQAVKLGTPVSESEYNDHTVRFEVRDNNGYLTTCGGLLIAGEYILTAGHCTGVGTYGANHEEYIPYLSYGASDSIDIYQSIYRYDDATASTTYTVVDIYGDFDTAYRTYLDEYAIIKSTYGAGKFSTQDSVIDADMISARNRRDISLIKLGTPVAQTTHAELIPIFDSSNSTFNVTTGDQFTFKGWGNTTTGAPEQMQKATFEVARESGLYAPQVAEDFSNGAIECHGGSTGCFYQFSDSFITNPTTVGGTASSGDSGTPMLKGDNSMFSIAISENSNGENFFINVGAYLETITAAIDKVIAPAMMNFTFDTSGAVDTHTSTIKVQNLTGSTETLSPSLTGDTHNFTVSGCNTTIAPQESCDLTVTVNPNANAITSDTSATVHLNDVAFTEIAISHKYQAPTEDPDNGDYGCVGCDGESGGGSGGSSSIGMLLGLLVLLRLRKNK
jgi:secreted trypsin-like serine protease